MAAVVVGSIGIAIGVGFLASHLEQRARVTNCDRLADEVAQSWDEGDAARVAESFSDTQLEHAEVSAAKLDRELDAWRDGLASTIGDGCRAHASGDVADDVWARRVTCHTDQRARLDDFVDALAPADRRVVNEAIRVAVEQPDPAACADDAALARRKPSASTEDVATDLRRRIARAELLAKLGREEPSREEAARARSDAIASGDAGLAAAAHLRWTNVVERDGDVDGAVAEAEAAYFAALRGGHDELAVRAAIELVRMCGIMLRRYDIAMEWSRHARTALARLGSEQQWLASEVVRFEARIAQERGEYDEAVAGLERVVQLHTAQFGADHPIVARVWVELGNVLIVRGDLDRAERALAEGDRIYAAAYGESSLLLANIATARCSLEYKRARHAASVSHCERALHLREVGLGPEHAEVAWALGNLSNAREAVGDHAGARELLERAITIQRPRLGPMHPDIGWLLNNLATIDMTVGDFAAAEPRLREALEIRRAAHPSGHLEIVDSALQLAKLLVTVGEPAEARQLYEEVAAVTTGSAPAVVRAHGKALAGLGVAAHDLGDVAGALAALERARAQKPFADEGDPAARCNFRHDYAHVLWSSGDRTPRVLELVADAHAACVEAGLRGIADVPELARWLALGRPPAGTDVAHERRRPREPS